MTSEKEANPIQDRLKKSTTAVADILAILLPFSHREREAVLKMVCSTENFTISRAGILPNPRVIQAPERVSRKLENSTKEYHSPKTRLSSRRSSPGRTKPKAKSVGPRGPRPEKDPELGNLEELRKECVLSFKDTDSESQKQSKRENLREVERKIRERRKLLRSFRSDLSEVPETTGEAPHLPLAGPGLLRPVPEDQDENPASQSEERVEDPKEDQTSGQREPAYNVS